jgi:hypothetical protein
MLTGAAIGDDHIDRSIALRKQHCSRKMNTGPAANQQLQRTVIRHRVRAASAALSLCARGAHDTSACRR